MAERRRVVSVTLFATLGLLAAFLVSAIAGIGAEPDVSDAAPGFAAPGLERSDTRVEVLNGAGTPGLARQATAQLRAAGFDVVFFGNADEFDREHSIVVDRIGSPERARAVSALLSIDSVTTAVDSSLMLEVTVVLGRDWPPRTGRDEGWTERLKDLFSER